MHASNMLHDIADTLGTKSGEMKCKVVRTAMACDNYAGMWWLPKPALRKNPLLVVKYRALLMLFKATVEAVQGASGSIEATLRMTTEQLIITVTDLKAGIREQVALGASKPNGYAAAVTAVWWLCMSTGYVDFNTQTSSGCARSALVGPMYCKVATNTCFREVSICNRGGDAAHHAAAWPPNPRRPRGCPSLPGGARSPLVKRACRRSSWPNN